MRPRLVGDPLRRSFDIAAARRARMLQIIV
jgi:hypothetical protein